MSPDSYSGLNFSRQLTALTKNFRFIQDTEGMSPAQVYQLAGRQENLYLKISTSPFNGTTYDVAREKNLMIWLKGQLPVPEVLHFEQHDGANFLLMREARGKVGYQDYALHRDPERMVRIYSEGIQLLQAIDITNCPFDSRLEVRLRELNDLMQRGLADVDTENWEEDTPFNNPEALFDYLQTNKPPEELAFSHGDFGDSNLFIEKNQISGLIDLGRSGKADRWYDIALCVRSIQHDLGNNPEYIDLFFHLLGIEPDWDKIRYYILLDELF